MHSLLLFLFWYFILRDLENRLLLSLLCYNFSTDQLAVTVFKMKAHSPYTMYMLQTTAERGGSSTSTLWNSREVRVSKKGPSLEKYCRSYVEIMHF